MRGQFSSATYFNRYPQIFSAAKQICDEESCLRPPLRVLSYGCSLGEELLSLRLYFPEAELFGCDINEDVLKSGADIAKQANATAFISTDASILEHMGLLIL